MSIAEENARAAAIGRYCVWLAGRYQRLDVVELSATTETTDPIALRQIYVPLRVAREDLADEQAFKATDGTLLPPEKESLPGEAAFDVLIQESFVAVSGKPGSGKTTLIHAIVAALADREPGELQRALPAIPVPFILRRLSDALPRVASLGDLFGAWWKETLEQASQDGLSLDRERLAEVLQPEDKGSLEGRPVLLLFDGIDELGGPETRQRVLNLAVAAGANGYRVLVTGRPAGFMGLRILHAQRHLEAEPVPAAWEPPLHHLQPFAWPQIRAFIGRWYALRDEWKRDAERGIQRFLDHLAEPDRRRLLDLARRPIFLTLMALVNCTENAMPEGRARLYEKIVDLYLSRQERFRQRRAFTDGTPIPQWDSGETRRVLARVAATGQAKATAEDGAGGDDRRCLWGRQELIGEVRGILVEGRFSTMGEGDAEALVKFFLNPAGLLVDPAEGQVQFAHLSFQEYLCTVDFHERGKVDENGPFVFAERELFPLLGRPGWDEVGLLFLCVYSEASSRQGHLNLMRRLDPKNPAQAALYVTALSGRELEFTDVERLDRLPVALICALLHPGHGLGLSLGRWQRWASDGMSWLIRLLQVPDEQLFEILVRDIEARGVVADAGSLWLALKVAHEAFVSESYVYPLLQLVAESGWGWREGQRLPQVSNDLDVAVAAFVGRQRTYDPFWHQCDLAQTTTVAPTEAAFILDRLITPGGRTAEVVIKGFPVAAIWIEGDTLPPDSYFLAAREASLAVLLPSRPEAAAVLLNGIFQVAMTVEAITRFGNVAVVFCDPPPYHSPTLARRSDVVRKPPPYLPRAVTRLIGYSYFSRPRNRHVIYPPGVSPPRPSNGTLQSLLRIYCAVDRPAPRPRQALRVWLEKLSLLQGPALVGPLAALVVLGLREGSIAWFQRQAQDPDLAHCRGIQDHQPLPKELGLFDASGRLKVLQRRSAILALRRWLDKPEEAFDWILRDETVDPAFRVRKLEEMHELWAQPWGPIAYVDALLADWPEEKEEVDLSLEAAERDLLAALGKAGF